MNTGFLDTNVKRTLSQWLLWWSCKSLHDCFSTLVIGGISFFRTDISTYLTPFHRLQTCLVFLLLLPLLVVVYQIQPSNMVKLQHFPLSNNTSVTTFVYRMIISPSCLFKLMKNYECVSMLFSAFWIKTNKNFISVSFCCREIMFQRVWTSIWDTLPVNSFFLESLKGERRIGKSPFVKTTAVIRRYSLCLSSIGPGFDPRSDRFPGWSFSWGLFLIGRQNKDIRGKFVPGYHMVIIYHVNYILPSKNGNDH